MATSFKTATYVIPANGIRTVNANGNYVTNLSANMTAGSLLIAFDTSGTSRFDAGDEYTLEQGQFFNSITLTNTTGASVTVQVGVAIGKISVSNAFTVQGAVDISKPTTNMTYPDVAMNTNAITALVAAASTTREVHISNLLANNSIMRVGDANTAAAQGNEIAIGETRIITTAGALYGFFVGAGKKVGLMTIGD